MSKKNTEKGLTLIELLITVAILAIVSAVAMPMLSNVTSATSVSAAASTVKNVDDFIANYTAANAVFTRTGDYLVASVNGAQVAQINTAGYVAAGGLETLPA